MSVKTMKGPVSRTRYSRCRRILLGLMAAFILLLLSWRSATHLNWNPRYEVGQEVDHLNNVTVFYNGGVGQTSGRNLAPDGYNLGIKYQCVEFVKRYYYEHLNHKMPGSYGHAKHFFNPTLADGALNTKRELVQYTNASESKPRPDDLLVFGPSRLKRYGHVAIVSEVTDSDVEIVQQNPGPFGLSRERLLLLLENGRWRFENSRVLGWLRKAPNPTVQRMEARRLVQLNLPILSGDYSPPRRDTGHFFPDTIF